MTDAIDTFLEQLDLDTKAPTDILELEEMEHIIAEARLAKQSICIVKKQPSFQIHFQNDTILLVWSSQTGEIDQNAFQKQIAQDLYLRFQGLEINASEDRVQVTRELHVEEASVDLLTIAEEACSFQEDLQIIDTYRLQALRKNS